MKYKNILIALLSILIFAVSCEKNVVATGDATVGFKSETMEYGFSKPLIIIPIITEGTTTVYPIKVNVKVKAYTGVFAAVEDKDYVITSTEIFIPEPDPENDEVVGVEITILNTSVDELRFELEITSQDNAQTLAISSTLIKLAKSTFDRLCGDYILTGLIDNPGEEDDGESVSMPIAIKGLGDNVLGVSGFNGEPADKPFQLLYDEKAKMLTLPFGMANASAAYGFGAVGNNYIAICSQISNGGAWDETPMTATWTETFDQIIFNNEGKSIAYRLYTHPVGVATGYRYGNLIKDFTLKRAPASATSSYVLAPSYSSNDGLVKGERIE